MKENINIKIITPYNEIVEMKYSDVLYYCEREVDKYISNSEKNLKHFIEFRKDYNYFAPYFDFVMSELKYILVNPFFHKDTYLLPYKNCYYIMQRDNYDYSNLINQVPKFSCDFLKATDQNICISKIKEAIKDKEGFFIDEEGNIFKNYCLDRHLKMARLILNQKIINKITLSIKYKTYIEKYGEYNMIEFLINNLGFVLGFPSNQDIIIYNSKKIDNSHIEKIKMYNKKYKIKKEDMYRND